MSCPPIITTEPITRRISRKWWFWNVRKRKRVIVVDLENERYSHLVLEVDDPDAAVASINTALAKRAA